MIDAAARHTDRTNIHYVGIDAFEDRAAADRAGLALIEAHRLLRQSAAKIKLIPGDPCEALVRSANALANIDLLLIAVPLEADRLERMSFFIPRMLHWPLAGAVRSHRRQWRKVFPPHRN